MNVSASDLLVVPAVATVASLLPLGRAVRSIGVASGLLVAALSIVLLATPAALAGEQRLVWLAPLGLSYHVGVDGLGGVLLVLSGVLFAVGAAASGDAPHPRGYMALWCALQTAVTGIFIAQDLLLFFVFWEAMLVPLSLLIWLWGGPDRGPATFRFLLYTMTGSAVFLVGIVGLGVAARTFDIVDLASKPISEGAQSLLAALFLAAFVVKLPLFPFHAWLPRAYLAAPIPVAIVLSGIIAKTAVYGIVHLCVGLFPLGILRLAPVLVSLAAVGALYGALLAFRQRDTRRIIAFASLSHLNLIGLGAFSASHLSIEGAAIASVSHGLVVAALFLLAAMLALRTGGFELDRASGLGASAPILAALFTLAVVAAIGVPGTSGFAGEFLILSGSFLAHPAAAIAATATVVVAAAYGLRLLRLAFFGPATTTAFDLRLGERALLVPLLALVLLLGLVPALVTDRISTTDLTPHAQVAR